LATTKVCRCFAKWSAPGKAIETRHSRDRELVAWRRATKRLPLNRRLSDGTALSDTIRSHARAGERGDPSAIPALQALLKRDDLSMTWRPLSSSKSALQKDDSRQRGRGAETDGEKSGDAMRAGVAQRLDKLEHLLQK